MTAGIITTCLLLLFVGGWVWVWNPRHKAEFDAAARMPLDDTETEPSARPAKELSP